MPFSSKTVAYESRCQNTCLTQPKEQTKRNSNAMRTQETHDLLRAALSKQLAFFITLRFYP